jgi:hypothetical protein
LFQKNRAEGGFAFKTLIITFFFKVGVRGKRKFSVLDFCKKQKGGSGATVCILL